MGKKFKAWKPLASHRPENYDELADILLANRDFAKVGKLEYGDHGLDEAARRLEKAIRENKRIALYADYDVDGTMSCVSWIWFFQAVGFTNYTHYIPCRFKEGYGVNLTAVKHLAENEKADVILTMDTGITANEEAEYCKSRGIEFICTDHHKIQPNKMPDCIIVNPKMHPDALYQELCGCGITFVLLRKIAEQFSVAPETWTDLLALAGMATICDVVPLNGVNHRLAKLGVDALMRSKRTVLVRLREAAQLVAGVDEKDVGFRLGPRINAVGRLGHADQVVKAFIDEDPTPLIAYMGECNESRKKIQAVIVAEARELALSHGSSPILFLGGDWHSGVVGIAASKIAEEFWRPTWLFQKKDGVGKGSARSIAGFDVTDAMTSAGHLFSKFGGHRAAGGYSFPLENEAAIREALIAHAEGLRAQNPQLWESSAIYDCELPLELADLPLADALDQLKPFGHGFEEPRFCLETKLSRTQFYHDKETGEPKHTAILIEGVRGSSQKIMFFNAVHKELAETKRARFLVSVSRNTFRGVTSLSLMGHDFELI